MHYDRDDLPCNVYNQYLETNLQTLLEGKCKIYADNMIPYKRSFQEYSDLNLATGTALDTKGRLLNMSRYITFNDRLNVVLPDSPGITEYKFLQGDTKQCRLNDDSYRIVLKLLSQSKNTVASVGSLSKIISDIVGADVFVGDNMNMRYITYYFLDRIPGWLEVTMHNYDILPRPAGMETQYISAISRLFGFLITIPEVDRETTAKLFSSFWKTRFPQVKTPPKHINSYSSFIAHDPYIVKNVSNEQLQEYRKDVVDEQKATYAGLQYNMQWENEQNHKAVAREQIKSINYLMYENEDIESPKETLATQLSSLMRYSDNILFDYRLHKSKILASLRDRELYISNQGDYEYYNLEGEPKFNLFLDESTGWYYYVGPDNAGNYDPSYLAPAYRDHCGLWRSTESLVLQYARRKVFLRENDHLRRIQKTLDTNPFIEYYKSRMSPLSFDLLTRPNPSENMVLWRQMIDDFHEGVQLYNKAMFYHKYSFRRILDLEYLALGIVRLTSSYEKRSSDRVSDPKGFYYNKIATRLRHFIGENISSYADLFKYSNRNAPIYKYRQFLIFLRREIKDIKAKLQELSDTNKRRYDTLRSHNFIVPNDFYYKLSWLKDQITKPTFFNNYEQSIKCGSTQKGWSQISKNNTQVKERYEFLEREAKWWRAQAGRLRSAAGACEDLYNMCNRGQSRQGQFSKVRLCWLTKDNAGMPNWNDGNDMSNTEVGHHNSQSFYDLGCASYENKRQWQVRFANDKDAAANNNDKEIELLKAEYKMRTPLTSSKTLIQILEDYDNMSLDDYYYGKYMIQRKYPGNKFRII